MICCRSEFHRRVSLLHLFSFFLFKNEHEHTFHISILIARVEIYFLQCKFAYRKTNVCPPFLICSKLSLCILWQQKRRIKLHQFFTAPVGFSWIIINRSDEPNASWFGSNKTFLVYKFELLVLNHFNPSYLNSWIIVFCSYWVKYFKIKWKYLIFLYHLITIILIGYNANYHILRFYTWRITSVGLKHHFPSHVHPVLCFLLRLADMHL